MVGLWPIRPIHLVIFPIFMFEPLSLEHPKAPAKQLIYLFIYWESIKSHQEIYVYFIKYESGKTKPNGSICKWWEEWGYFIIIIIFLLLFFLKQGNLLSKLFQWLARQKSPRFEPRYLENEGLLTSDNNKHVYGSMFGPLHIKLVKIVRERNILRLLIMNNNGHIRTNI